MLDKAYNFAKSLISPLASGAVTVTLTDPSKFVDPASGEYNCTIWCSSLFASPVEDPNKEIVRFTAKSGSDYTITRAQEGTSDVNHNSGGELYSIAIGITAKMINDIATELSGKQASLGFTPEDVANKSNNVAGDAASTTKYPSVKAFKDYTDGLVVGLLDFRGAYDASMNAYPSTGGSGSAGAIMKGDMWIISVGGTMGTVVVHTGDSVIANTDTPGQTDSKWNVLNGNVSYVPEDAANKVTSISGSSTDTQYPSAKLVYDQLAGKQATLTFGIANTNKVQIDSDTVADNDYAKFTANGLEGRSYSEVLSDIGAEPAKGADDNYVTDAEKTVIGNTSGVNTGDEPDASTTVKGIVELAIASEVNTGTSDTLAITPDALAGSTAGKRLIQVKIVDDSTALTTGDGKIIFLVPEELNGMNLVQAEAFCSTVSSSGLPTVQVRNVTDSVDMLSTVITIDATEYTSYTAATRSVVDTTHDDVATGDRLAIDIDVAGTGTKGLGVILSFQLP